jgi:chromosome partitioning protein
MLIRLSERPSHFAHLPKRSSIAEAQGDGQVLWDMKKTAARDAWREIEPSLARVAQLLMAPAANVVAAADTTASAHAHSPGAV